MVHEEPAPITPEVLGNPGERFVLIEDPRFTVYGDIRGGNLFLHCSPIKQWSRSTYEACLEAMIAIKLQALHYDFPMLYVFLPLRKMKFATMMGFTPQDVYNDHAEEPYVFCSQKAGLL